MVEQDARSQVANMFARTPLADLNDDTSSDLFSSFKVGGNNNSRSRSPSPRKSKRMKVKNPINQSGGAYMDDPNASTGDGSYFMRPRTLRDVSELARISRSGLEADSPVPRPASQPKRGNADKSLILTNSINNNNIQNCYKDSLALPVNPGYSAFKSEAVHARSPEYNTTSAATNNNMNKGHYAETRSKGYMSLGVVSNTSLEVRNPGYLDQSLPMGSTRQDGMGSKMKSSVDSEGEAEEPLGIFGVLIHSWPISWMFLFIPVGIASYWLKWGAVAVFCFNFLAIVPQAWIIGKCTEDLASATGQIIGGLLNAWFGNIVEMLLCVAGLHQAELVVVRSTLIGSILSNLLLVTGCSFLFGGFLHKIQEFSAIGASTNSSLMTLSCLCLGLPTMYSTILTGAGQSTLQISRTVSIFLVFIYLQYMIFQLGTHSFLFDSDEEDDEVADLSPVAAAIVLGIATVTCSFNSEYLISSIEGVVGSANLSKEFVGIILLPIIGNAAEHYTSVVVAMKNKMDLSIACAVGSSCQMALFVTPFTVLVGWAMGQPMSLDLHAFEVLVLLFAVLVLTSILQDGFSNWLEGSMLMSAYVVIAITYFFEDPRYSEII